MEESRRRRSCRRSRLFPLVSELRAKPRKMPRTADRTRRGNQVSAGVTARDGGSQRVAFRVSRGFFWQSIFFPCVFSVTRAIFPVAKSARLPNRRDRAPGRRETRLAPRTSDGLFVGSGGPLVFVRVQRIAGSRGSMRAARARAPLCRLAAHGARNARQGRKSRGRRNARGARGEKRARREPSTSERL